MLYVYIWIYIFRHQLFNKAYFIQKKANDNLLIFYWINIILHLILFTILFTKDNDNPLVLKTLLQPNILIQTCRNFKMHFLQRFLTLNEGNRNVIPVYYYFQIRGYPFGQYIGCHQIELTLTRFLVHFYPVKK